MPQTGSTAVVSFALSFDLVGSFVIFFFEPNAHYRTEDLRFLTGADFTGFAG